MARVSKNTKDKRSPAGVRWALMVINDHNELSKESQEIKALVQILQEKHHYQPDNIIFLGAEDVKGEQEILDCLETLIQSINPGDTILIRFSDDRILDDDRIRSKLGMLDELKGRIII